MSSQTKQLFIYGNVPASSIVLNSVKSDVNVIRIPRSFLIGNFDNNVTRVGFMWRNDSPNSPKFPFDGIIPLIKNNITFRFFTQGFYDFANQFTNPVEIDLITCNLNAEWFINEVAQLKRLLPNVSIEYSTNKTGSANGDDWIMESNNESIKDVFFNNNINNYNFSLDVSSTSSVVIRDDGSVWGAGQNQYSQLGDGTTNNVFKFKQIFPSTGKPNKGQKAISVSSSNYNVGIALEDGTVWMSGNNVDSQMGNTHPGTVIFQQVYPSTGLPLTNQKAIQIICGDLFTEILLEDGSVLGSGYNGWQQFGTSDLTLYSFTTIYSPTNSETKVIQVATSPYTTMLVLENGIVLGSGSNYYGQLGIGTPTSGIISYYTQVYPLVGSNFYPEGEKKAIQASLGYLHSVILLKDGSVWITGDGVSGQLGNNYPLNPEVIYLTEAVQFQQSYPLPGKNFDDKKVTEIAAGGYSSSFLKNGKLFNTGDNSYGELGIGQFEFQITMFNEVNFEHKIKQISATSINSFILTDNGDLWITGDNSLGQLGNNASYETAYHFVKVLNKVKQLSN
jgi:alpha-tubulin suppressor-like RCC1 family protein